MPIITPAFPAFNSTFNVSKTTKAIILKEMRKAQEILKRVNKGEVTYERLFKSLDFLKAYRWYLRIDVLVNDYDEKRFFGHVESKLKRLVKAFEEFEKSIATYYDYTLPIMTAHPYIRSFPTFHPNFRSCKTFFMGIDLKKREAPEEEEKAEENGEDEKEDKYKGVEQMSIPLDDIIASWFEFIFPVNATEASKDFPAEHLPHNIDIRVTPVKREQIPDILRMPEKEEAIIAQAEGEEAPQEYELGQHYINNIKQEDEEFKIGYKRVKVDEHLA